MNKINVSVIVPVYNVEKYLDKCIESLLNQTLKNIEIILVDDGSKDNSLQICREYGQKDSRIKVYTKENEGLGLTRNYGIDRANGEYIAFVDSDDFISSDFYEKLYNKAKKENVESCFGNMKVYVDDDHIIDSDCIPFKNDVIPSKKLIYNMLRVEDKKDYKKVYMGMSSCRAIYKLDIIKNVAFVENVYYFYRKNMNSLSKSYNKDKFTKSLVFFDELIRRTKNYGIYEDTKKGIFCLFGGYVRNSLKQEILLNNAPEKERKKITKNILHNNKVKKMVKITCCEDIKKMVINFAIKFKMNGFLWFAYKKMNKGK